CTARSGTTESPGTKRVTFEIDTGEKVAVNSVKIVGARQVPETDIRRQILTGVQTLFRRETLNPEILAADVSAVENLYRSRGFLRAQARSRVALSPDARRAFVTIEIVEGPSFHLRTVEVAGNSALPLERP